MSVLVADTIKSRTGAALSVSDSIVVSSSIISDGAVAVKDLTESTNSTNGALVISGGVGIGKSLHVSGNVSIGGTLTYEDVTNQDVIGFATFRSGVKFGVAGVGGSVTGTGHATFAGIVTASSFSGNATSATSATSAAGLTGTPNITVGNITGVGVNLSGICTVSQGTNLDGYKVEEGKQDGSTALNGEFDFELENGHVQRYSTATGGNYFPDFRVSSSQSLSSVMDVGDVISVTLIVASSSHYCTTGIKIDNSTSNLDIDWVGGSAPSAANGSGFDVYAFTIMKTAATPAYHIIGNALGVA